MAANNAFTTNQPASTFLVESQGYVQGLALDDTVARQWLAEGTLVGSAGSNIWGGVPITELINLSGTGNLQGEGLGPTVQAATAQGNVTAFSTFQQMMHGVITPSSPVPTYGPTNGVGFFRLGTNARLVVACDPALVAALNSADGAINSQALFWDVTNFRITLVTTGGNFALPTSIRLQSVQLNSKIVNPNSGNPVWATGAAAVLIL